MDTKQLKEYIERYILPNETKENIILYYDGSLQYDEEYIKEHIKYNKLIIKL
tara:strand:+ start:220 stop:375 length:156 start_codon:yes stop_codon:yes gene_type:complete